MKNIEILYIGNYKLSSFQNSKFGIGKFYNYLILILKQILIKLKYRPGWDRFGIDNFIIFFINNHSYLLIFIIL
jgi:hypothetical protein